MSKPPSRSWAKEGRTWTDAEGVRRLQTGWERVHICVDDATRLAYVEVLDHEKAADSAVTGTHREQRDWHLQLVGTLDDAEMTLAVLAPKQYRALFRPVIPAFPIQARRVAPNQVIFWFTRNGGDQIVNGSAAELARFRPGNRRSTTDLSLTSGNSDPCSFPWIRTSSQEHA